MATPSAGSSRSESGGFVVGLTGGIGSGKTTASTALQAHGAAVIDTDVIAHALTTPGGAAMPAIAAQFGPEFMLPDGALDRARMRALVFEAPTAKQRLEAILHPLIRAITEAKAARAAASSPYVVLAIPLLVESGTWRARVDRVLVVDCSNETQIARVQRRSNLDAQAVRRIIAQQATRAARLDAADDVVMNESDAPALLRRIARLHDLYTSLASARVLQGV
jgi:dephospho-CoA kinase